MGTRRSTRVFIPKSVAKSSDSDEIRVLRSGERLISSESVTRKQKGEEDEWLGLLENPHRADFCRCKGEDRDRMYGIVYNRKRQRLPEARVSIDRMYGIPFVKKQSRKKLIVPLRTEISEQNKESEITETVLNSPNFVRGRILLIAFVESSPVSSRLFVLFLVYVLGLLRRSRLRLSELYAFLSLEWIAKILSMDGIHFLAVPSSEDCLSCIASCRGAFPTVGVCTIFGARCFVPLVSLNFSVAPLYFMSLLSGLFLASEFLPGILVSYFENATSDIHCSERDSCIPTEMGISKIKILDSGSPSVKRSAVDCTFELTELDDSNVLVRHCVKLWKHQKRRSSMRSARVPKKSLMKLNNGGLHSELNGNMKLHSAAKGLLVPIREKTFDICGTNFLGIRNDNVVYSSPRSSHRQRKSARNSSAPKGKELNSTLIDRNQNIDSVSCSANILVIESNRCWRECGAEVMLECSGSNEWLLAVKARGSTRYLHKAQEMRRGTYNRYTRAIIWTGESSWKLEFCDRKYWRVFKELHKECCERNKQGAPVRLIPMLGVREMFGYGDGEAVPFVQPYMYITTKSDEVGRALLTENTYYDMDSVDEKWLEKLNSNFHDSDGTAGHISKDNFEKIIYAFEKAAYTHPIDVSDENRATSLCLDLGRRDMVAAVYGYWLKKRNQKESWLVRIFQGQPPEWGRINEPSSGKKRSFQEEGIFPGRGEPSYNLNDLSEKGQPPEWGRTHEPSSGKKRSFWEEGIFPGRGEPASFLKAHAEQEAMKRLKEAEHKAEQEAMKRLKEAEHKAEQEAMKRLKEAEHKAEQEAMKRLKEAEYKAEQEAMKRLLEDKQKEIQEAMKRVRKTEQEAKRLVEIAGVKRRKARMLWQNAELATYKSVMAFKIAEAVEESLEASSMLIGLVLHNGDKSTQPS
ncbi:uncharacterized protein LOC143877588 [Tasmannia lanceolata]|uniref:uncharacterized protein LOC143877588 n=1 Tax=Tasmannia lanceolata TaxID=3420 RepID=UPI004062CBA2